MGNRLLRNLSRGQEGIVITPESNSDVTQSELPQPPEELDAVSREAEDSKEELTDEKKAKEVEAFAKELTPERGKSLLEKIRNMPGKKMIAWALIIGLKVFSYDTKEVQAATKPTISAVKSGVVTPTAPTLPSSTKYKMATPPAALSRSTSPVTSAAKTKPVQAKPKQASQQKSVSLSPANPEVYCETNVTETPVEASHFSEASYEKDYTTELDKIDVASGRDFIVNTIINNGGQKNIEGMVVHIDGQASFEGSALKNQQLSEERAELMTEGVKNQLSVAGIDVSKIIFKTTASGENYDIKKGITTEKEAYADVFSGLIVEGILPVTMKRVTKEKVIKRFVDNVIKKYNAGLLTSKTLDRALANKKRGNKIIISLVNKITKKTCDEVKEIPPLPTPIPKKKDIGDSHIHPGVIPTRPVTVPGGVTTTTLPARYRNGKIKTKLKGPGIKVAGRKTRGARSNIKGVQASGRSHRRGIR